MSEIKFPLSVIDGTKIALKDAFSWVLHYFDPNKNTPKVSSIIDTTCSEMLMWKDDDKKKFNVITNDIRPEINSDYHLNCYELDTLNQKFDIVIYDPPYIDLENRQDTKKYEAAFNYCAVKDLNQFILLNYRSVSCFRHLVAKNGIIIAKITNFHYNGELHGSMDLINSFTIDFKYFKLIDEVIYRFYKPIPNLNFYSKKIAITHSYFLIFKKQKDDGEVLF